MAFAFSYEFGRSHSLTNSAIIVVLLFANFLSIVEGIDDPENGRLSYQLVGLVLKYIWMVSMCELKRGGGDTSGSLDAMAVRFQGQGRTRRVVRIGCDLRESIGPMRT